jgi:hyperosmotically inducible protein
MNLISDVKTNIRTFLVMGSLLGAGAMLTAPGAMAQNPAPDNTTVNQRDRDTSEATADQQKNSPSDRDLTKQIRQSIVSDKSLSTYAHNVKVITQNGQVTLKGPVRSDDEKRAVEAKATDIAGKDKVTSELAIKPKS